MTDLSFEPARKTQIRELTFEQLLDSDEAAALLTSEGIAAPSPASPKLASTLRRVYSMRFPSYRDDSQPTECIISGRSIYFFPLLITG